MKACLGISSAFSEAPIATAALLLLEGDLVGSFSNNCSALSVDPWRDMKSTLSHSDAVDGMKLNFAFSAVGDRSKPSNESASESLEDRYPDRRSHLLCDVDERLGRAPFAVIVCNFSGSKIVVPPDLDRRTNVGNGGVVTAMYIFPFSKASLGDVA